MSTLAPPCKSRAGFVLLATLAFLCLLFVVAIVFVTLAQTELAAASSHADAVRARSLALSGIEYGIARLRIDAGRRTFSDPAAAWRYGGGPLEAAAAPSYRGGAALGHAYSGSSGGTYAAYGDQFALKIIDTGTQIHLNLRTPALAAMLDTLGAAIAEDSAAQGRPRVDPIAGRGAAIVALRGPAGFARKEILLPLLGPGDYRLVEDYLSIQTWTDPNTVAGTGAIRPDGMRDFVVEPRAPVNVNGASWPVLVAVLAGLRGPTGGAVPYATARTLATAICRRRASVLPTEGPFRSWKQFYEFIRGLAVGPGALLSPEWSWAILANADPNFHPTWLNLERVLHLPVDKIDLSVRTTEFCFREMGLYEITALARVLGADGLERASAKATALARIFRVLYHTTQADFESRRATGPEENATTWPNPPIPVGANPAAWAGHVQLQTWQPTDGPLAPPASLAAYLRRQVPAEIARGDPVPITDQEDAPDVSRDGDLLPEGLLFTGRRNELTAWTSSGNASADAGTLDFWIKFDEPATTLPVPLALLTYPATSEAGVQHLLRAALVDGTLTVESTRLFYVAKGYGTEPERKAFPVPYLLEESTAMAVLAGHGQPHEWHHIAVSWSDGIAQDLFVDGEPAVTTSVTPTSSDVVFDGWPPFRDQLLFGGADTEVRGREVVSAVIDDPTVRMAADPLGAGDALRPRFEDVSPLYAGRFEGGFDPIPEPIHLLGISWTEWVPDTYNGIPLVDLPASIDLGLDLGSGIVPVGTDAVEPILAGLGLGVVVQNRSVRYEIRFKHAPTVTPLNVTPILDDLIIAYRPERVELVSFQWISDD